MFSTRYSSSTTSTGSIPARPIVGNTTLGVAIAAGDGQQVAVIAAKRAAPALINPALDESIRSFAALNDEDIEEIVVKTYGYLSAVPRPPVEPQNPLRALANRSTRWSGPQCIYLPIRDPLTTFSPVVPSAGQHNDYVLAANSAIYSAGTFAHLVFPTVTAWYVLSNLSKLANDDPLRIRAEENIDNVLSVASERLKAHVKAIPVSHTTVPAELPLKIQELSSSLNKFAGVVDEISDDANKNVIKVLDEIKVVPMVLCEIVARYAVSNNVIDAILWIQESMAVFPPPKRARPKSMQQEQINEELNPYVMGKSWPGTEQSLYRSRCGAKIRNVSKLAPKGKSK